MRKDNFRGDRSTRGGRSERSTGRDDRSAGRGYRREGDNSRNNSDNSRSYDFDRREHRGFESRGDRRSYGNRDTRGGENRDTRGFERRDDRRDFLRDDRRNDRRNDRRDDNRRFERRDRFEHRPERTGERMNNGRTGERTSERTSERNFSNRTERGRYDRREDRSTERRNDRRDDRRPSRKEISEEAKISLREKHYSKKKLLAHSIKSMNAQSELRLNRFISMGGVCSRRDADTLIEEGRVRVNGKVVEQIGHKVLMSDRVEVDGQIILPEKKVYILLNKPKDFVTTVDDPLNRKTVMSLIAGACKERVYPVGRLDRNTTGVLLFTNDGDLAKKLTHPSYDRKKIYHVFLNKSISESDIEQIREGFELEDGFIKADDISITSTDKTEVGIEIHSGRNRIVRRIFEHIGYEVEKLDRVYFAGITKKNVPRGKWRMLTSKEVSMLKIY